VFQFNSNEDLAVGNYTIPFKFKLPDELPSSMHYKNGDHKDIPSIKVKYHIRVDFLQCSI